jgi:hypothetical protein
MTGKIEIANHLDGVEDKIDAFIFSVSGIHLKEETIGDKFTLRFGHKDLEPLEVGFYKNRHPEITDFRFLAYLTMLNEVSKFMNAVPDFEVFCYHNKMYNT